MITIPQGNVRRHVVLSALVCAGLAGACNRASQPANIAATTWAVVDGRNITKDDVEKVFRASVDPAKAVVYYKEAAVKGQPDAEEAIGLAFYTGNGVPKDLVSARQWFLKASEDANPDAMFNLAVMMVNGEGGPKDLVKAYAWFYIADKGGVEKAGAAMRELAAKMTPDERTQADALLNPKAKS